MGTHAVAGEAIAFTLTMNMIRRKEEAHKLSWEGLETRIGRWITYLHGTVSILTAELKLAKAVLPAEEVGKAFAGVIAETVNTLVSVGETMVRSKKTPEKVFALLDMMGHFEHSLPHLASMLQDEACAHMNHQLKDLMEHLAVASRETFYEFEDAVSHDAV
eukprot:gene27630-34098_t